MFLAAFYTSIEFLVSAAVIAAAIVAYSAMPAKRNAVVTKLLPGNLSLSANGSHPAIELEALPDRNVILHRRGVCNIGLEGSVSVAIEINSRDILVKERLIPGKEGQNQMVDATFLLDFMGPERYHIRYESEDTGLYAVATFANYTGVKLSRQLKS